MPHSMTLPTTFAGFPAYDPAESVDARIAVVGVPYLSPYPVAKAYDSLNAPAAVRQASLTYQLLNLMRGLSGKGSLMGLDFVEVVPERDLANLTSLFAARQILNFMGVAAHGGQFSQRRSVPPA